jgi:hypothetical protein
MWEADPAPALRDRDNNEMPRGTRHATVARHDPMTHPVTAATAQQNPDPAG